MWSRARAGPGFERHYGCRCLRRTPSSAECRWRSSPKAFNHRGMVRKQQNGIKAMASSGRLLLTAEGAPFFKSPYRIEINCCSSLTSLVPRTSLQPETWTATFQLRSTSRPCETLLRQKALQHQVGEIAACASEGENLAIGLNQDQIQPVRARRKLVGDNPIGAKRGIETAIGVK